MSATQADRDFVITPYCSADFEAIMALENRCFPDPWSRGSMESCLATPVVKAYVARREETVLGFVIAYIIPPEGEIADVCVSPEERGKGIAKALMNTMIEESGCESFFLEVRASNRSAIGLYGKLGFAVLGVRKRYYDKPREDAIVMGLDRGSLKGE